MLAKLVIALACHAGDRGFEPRCSRQKPSSMRKVFLLKKEKSGISAAGSALASGVRGRRFESAIPDIKKICRSDRFFFAFFYLAPDGSGHAEACVCANTESA